MQAAGQARKTINNNSDIRELQDVEDNAKELTEDDQLAERRAKTARSMTESLLINYEKLFLTFPNLFFP